MPSMPVAEQGYRGFQANKRVVITGARNRVGAALSQTMPRSMVLRMVRYIQSPHGR
jgi:short-subunit dehydrogenase